MSAQPPSRRIAVRLVVTGTLRLITPTQLGNGDAESITDMPLLRDAVSDQPLLTGTSVAGALRAYLQRRVAGNFAPENAAHSNAASLLFGSVKGDDEGEQSPLIVDDALGVLPNDAGGHSLGFEVRDGVRIDGKTRTAQDKRKYDLELLPAGTIFALRFELLLPEDAGEATALREALALALSGLAANEERPHGEIYIGARRSRGFGRCTVAQWQAAYYDLKTPSGVLAWLTADHAQPQHHPEQTTGTAAAILPVEGSSTSVDRRRSCVLTARFALESPLLVRSTEPLSTEGKQPDTTHLLSWRGTQRPSPVLPGTSLAGALRARATRIANTLQPGHGWRVQTFIDGMFGQDMDGRERDRRLSPTASRLIVEESEIDGGRALVQSRVAIDRFTGGAYDTALFSEAPHVGGGVQLQLTLAHQGTPTQQRTEQAQIGMLLLLLKDLWMGDLPLGGASSIGRGRLRGEWATLTIHDGAAPSTEAPQWRIERADQAEPGNLAIRGNHPAGDLQTYVDQLQAFLEAT